MSAVVAKSMLLFTYGKLPDPRSLVLNKEVKVTNGIKGYQHREKNVLPKMYFEIHEEEID
ncbi:MAG: hypothetical protein P8N10_06545 [SAR86 cluster bacterium]|nr:hypothetical protein [SAR86 cluster bacterium]